MGSGVAANGLLVLHPATDVAMACPGAIIVRSGSIPVRVGAEECASTGEYASGSATVAAVAPGTRAARERLPGSAVVRRGHRVWRDEAGTEPARLRVEQPEAWLGRVVWDHRAPPWAGKAAGTHSVAGSVTQAGISFVSKAATGFVTKASTGSVRDAVAPPMERRLIDPSDLNLILESDLRLRPPPLPPPPGSDSSDSDSSGNESGSEAEEQRAERRGRREAAHAAAVAAAEGAAVEARERDRRAVLTTAEWRRTLAWGGGAGVDGLLDGRGNAAGGGGMALPSSAPGTARASRHALERLAAAACGGWGGFSLADRMAGGGAADAAGCWLFLAQVRGHSLRDHPVRHRLVHILTTRSTRLRLR